MVKYSSVSLVYASQNIHNVPHSSVTGIVMPSKTHIIHGKANLGRVQKIDTVDYVVL